jgi:hypothetical protein
MVMEGFQLDRHFKLWEENNKSLKRLTFVTVVISIALIVKVLTPFVDDSGSKKPILQKIETLNAEKAVTTRKIQAIEKTESVLQDVNRFIAAQPWQKEKSDLIERYRRMNTTPSLERISPARYQDQADATMHTIGKMLREQILKPLRNSMAAPGQAQDLGNLNNAVTTLGRFIDGWESHYIGKNWYQTLNRKEATMLDLTKELNRRLSDFSAVIEHELQSVKQAREAVNAQLQTLNSTIVSEGDKLKDIEKELQAILPTWLRGLVTTEQVIQLLPVFLLGAAIYVFYIGLGLTRHYQIYVAGKEFKQGVTTDPAMSSIWTLIARGRYGTLLTMTAYVVFFVLVWGRFEKSVGLLLQWIAIDPGKAWIASQTSWGLFLWCSRLAFIALIVYVCAKPWRTGAAVTA